MEAHSYIVEIIIAIIDIVIGLLFHCKLGIEIFIFSIGPSVIIAIIITLFILIVIVFIFNDFLVSFSSFAI